MEAPPVIAKRETRFTWWIGGALAAITATAILFQFSPTEHPFYPRCALYSLTGIYCPGCGGLRAMHSLLHGRWLAALHFNPLAVIALPFMGFAMLRLMLLETTGRRLAPRQIPAGWIKLLLAVILVFTVARNLPFAPFTYLSPP